MSKKTVIMKKGGRSITLPTRSADAFVKQGIASYADASDAVKAKKVKTKINAPTYGTRAMTAETTGEPVKEAPVVESIVTPVETLRSEYEAKVGRKPFMGWDADKLREKIDNYKAPSEKE